MAAGVSDHFLVETKVVVAKEWGNRIGGCRREEIKVEELKKPEKKQEYQERLNVVYERVKGRAVGEVEEEWNPMKESLVGSAGWKKPWFFKKKPKTNGFFKKTIKTMALLVSWFYWF